MINKYIMDVNKKGWDRNEYRILAVSLINTYISNSLTIIEHLNNT